MYSGRHLQLAIFGSSALLTRKRLSGILVSSLGRTRWNSFYTDTREQSQTSTSQHIILMFLPHVQWIASYTVGI
jgi:hypothetical protein